MWGGQVEIIALSKALNVQIKVIQAEAPYSLIFGDEFPNGIVIVYYRYLCTLGEHYNSVVPLIS